MVSGRYGGAEAETRKNCVCAWEQTLAVIDDDSTMRCCLQLGLCFVHVTYKAAGGRAGHTRGGPVSLISSRGHRITEHALTTILISDYNTGS